MINTGAVLIERLSQRHNGRKPMNETRPAFAAIILMGFLLVAFLSSTPGHAQTLDEVYQKAVTEGGTLNFYGTLAPNQASKILPSLKRAFLE